MRSNPGERVNLSLSGGNSGTHPFPSCFLPIAEREKAKDVPGSPTPSRFQLAAPPLRPQDSKPSAASAVLGASHPQVLL